MRTAGRAFLRGLLIAAAMVPLTFTAGAQAPTPDEAKAIAEEAYIYGYSLISVEMSRKVITNVEKPEPKRAPMGQFANLREYPNADYRDVTAPNADTLYSNAFVDVSKEPWIISWPDMGDRYYVWEFYNMKFSQFFIRSSTASRANYRLTVLPRSLKTNVKMLSGWFDECATSIHSDRALRGHAHDQRIDFEILHAGSKVMRKP